MVDPSRVAGAFGIMRLAPVAWVIAKLRQHAVSLVALAIRGLAVAAGFAVTYFLGHNLGPEATGQYALISQTALFLATAGLLGLDIGVVRHLAKTMADRSAIALATMSKVTAVAMGLMVLISVALWLGGDRVWSALFADGVPRELLAVLCILLIGRGGAMLFGGMLRSQHRFNLGQFITALIIPGATAAALVAGWVTDVNGALWVGALAGLAGLLIGAIAMIRHVSPAADAVRVSMNDMMRSSLPLWGVGMAMVIGEWYGLYIASKMLSLKDAGLYRVAVQIAAALQIIWATIFSIYSAKISTAFHGQDRLAAALFARSALRVSAALVIPAGLIMAVLSPLLLDFIGVEFAAALPVVLVLIAGQMAYALLGPPGIVLAMAGRERINLSITLFGMVVLLAVTPIAAQYGGLVGMATAISVVMLMRNIIAYFIVRRSLGIGIWSGTITPV